MNTERLDSDLKALRMRSAILLWGPLTLIIFLIGFLMVLLFDPTLDASRRSSVVLALLVLILALAVCFFLVCLRIRPRERSRITEIRDQLACDRPTLRR